MSINKQLYKLGKTQLGNLIVGIAFGKFSQLLPLQKIKETDKVLAFWHPNPYWEKHILIVPKKRISKIPEIKKSDSEYIFDAFKIIKELVTELEWESKGYTVSTNGGNRQEINQLHFHLWSGKKI